MATATRYPARRQPELGRQDDPRVSPCPPRSLHGYKTAYPRVAKRGTDPGRDLFAGGAHIAPHPGRPTAGLLDHYRWARNLRLNQSKSTVTGKVEYNDRRGDLIPPRSRRARPAWRRRMKLSATAPAPPASPAASNVIFLSLHACTAMCAVSARRRAARFTVASDRHLTW